jgi:very-short-patch-repair endonuclease
MPADLDRRLDPVFARQHGLVSRKQVYESGANRVMVLDRLESGTWVRLSRQVFRTASAPVTWEQAALAAVLHHPEALAAGRTSLVLHALEGVTPTRPEVVVPHTANARSPLAVVHRSEQYQAMRRTVVNRLPTQTAAEGVVLAARTMLPEDLTRLVGTAINRRQLSIQALADVHARHAGDRLRHIGVLGEIIAKQLPDAPAPPMSALEAKLTRLLDHPAIPPVRTQVPLPLLAGRKAVVDVFIEGWGLIVEADGRAWHTRVEDFERDRERDNAAMSMGLAVLRFTWRMLTEDRESSLNQLLATGRARTAPSARR